MNRPSRKNPTTAARKGDSKRGFYIILAVLAIAGIATLGYQATRPSAQAAFTMDSAIVLVPNQGHLMGSDTALVEVVEFADFECPACGDFATLTEPDVRTRLVNTGLIRFRFMDFPLDGHRNTLAAHLAAWCASDQGKFWEMHDQIFANQHRWSGYATSRPVPVFEELARNIGLNEQQFRSCMESGKFLGQIRANMDEGFRRGVNSTPTFFIGNQRIAGKIPYDELKRQVDQAIAQARAAQAAGTKAGATSGSQQPRAGTKAP